MKRRSDPETDASKGSHVGWTIGTLFAEEIPGPQHHNAMSPEMKDDCTPGKHSVGRFVIALFAL